MKINTLCGLAMLLGGVTLYAQQGTNLNFEGPNDYVLVSNSNSPITATYTKEAWVNGSDYNGARDFFSGSSSSQNAFWVVGGLLTAGHNGASGGGNWSQVIDDVPLSINTWYHVAISYDAATTTMKLYKNGELVDTNTNVPMASNNPTTGRLYIGCYNGNNALFNGEVDEIRLWNKVLTQEEIQSNMNCEFLDGPIDGLVLYYKFNQGIANGDNTGLTSVVDSSGNNINGTLLNFALNGMVSNWVSGSVVPAPDCPALAINDFLPSNSQFYPNPVNDEINIAIHELDPKAKLEISDVNGRILSTHRINSQNSVIQLQNYSSGIYILKLYNGHQVTINKIIKK